MAVTCIRCGKDMDSAPGCVPGVYMDGAGGLYQPIPYSGAGTGPACPECGAVRGEPHHVDCGAELCPKCGARLLGCACRLMWRPAGPH